MQVIFWGTRGSLPASVTAGQIRKKIFEAIKMAQGRIFESEKAIHTFIEQSLPFSISSGFGTNTSCVQLDEGGEETVLCDAGSGLRDYGRGALGEDAPKQFHIFLSHLHWDHLQGFPFFIPAYLPGRRVDFYGCHQDLEAALRRQQDPPWFPVRLEQMKADMHFHLLEPEHDYEIAGFRVRAQPQRHPGVSYTYRFERQGRKIVYSTDAEHKDDAFETGYPLIDFVRGADVLIFDAQYLLRDNITVNEDWGHSNNVTGVEIASQAGVKHLCLFHSDPNNDDGKLEKLGRETQRYADLVPDSSSLKVTLAYDGLRINV